MKSFSVKGKIYYSSIIIIVAIIAFIYGIMTDNYFFYGFSISAFIISIYMLIKNIIILKDPKKLKAVEIENNDERNILITVKSYALTFRIFIILEAIASIICAIFNEMIVCDILAYLIFIQLFMYIIIRTIVSKIV